MNDLKQVAVGALSGYWPAHLGLNTDAERVEWLARQVERLADEAGNSDELQDRVEDLETAISGHVETIADLQGRLSRIRAEAAA